jgi:Predicted hydrolases or acyltransferases (alpha/beta hydrolase superfamily)
VVTTAPFCIDLGRASLVGTQRPGIGTPLVLIHGFGGSQHDWDAVVRALPPELATIAYDQRGFGGSCNEPGLPFSHTDDLLALLDALHVEQADLCGISLGGGTALSFALSYPERVRRLVLISPLMVGWSWTSDWIERWKQIGRAARSGDMATARELWWQHPLFETTRASAAASRLRAAIDAFHGRQWVQDDQRPESPDLDRITRLGAPTLLLTGGRDIEDFRQIADVIAGAGRDVTRIDHREAGHLLPLEIPGPIAEQIAAFLGT